VTGGLRTENVRDGSVKSSERRAARRHDPQARTRRTDTTAIAPSDPSRAPEQPTLTLERWELVPSPTGDALLRLAGRWDPEPPARVQLVRCTPDPIDAIAPLPPGAQLESDGSWAVAFAIDAEAAIRDRLVLWPGGGQAIVLPAPVRRSAPLVGTVQEGQAAERAQREMAKLREQLAAAHAALAAAAETPSGGAAQPAPAAAPEPASGEKDETADTAEGPEPKRPRLRRAAKVSADKHREALAERDAERVHSARLEDEIARATDEKRQLENELAQAGTVEADLRHLLDARERALVQLRSELSEQRARYATVAGQLPGNEAEPEREEERWSALDQELLDRIARAKALSGDA
jgi:hypothetical protein